jgi:hypothetical protein
MGDIIKQCKQYSEIEAEAVLHVDEVGESFYNAHKILAGIKKGLDPNNVANPTRLLNMETIDRGTQK